MKRQGKRLLSILLSTCLLLNMTSFSAAAEPKSPPDRQIASDTKPDAVSASPSDAEKDTSQKPKPGGTEKEDLADRTEQDALVDSSEENRTEPITLTAKDEDIFIDPEIFSDLPDNDELFAGYVEQVMYGSSEISTHGNFGENTLSGPDKRFYEKLKNQIKEIASGSRRSTKIPMTISELGSAKTSWTASELGVALTTQENGKTVINPAAMTAIRKKILPDNTGLNQIIRYLLVNCPYEMYWYDKTASGTHLEGLTYSYSSNGKTASISIPSSISFAMMVAPAYQDGNSYTVNQSKASAARTAAGNAQAIVRKHASEPDDQKLYSYLEEICALVSYNTAAANGSTAYGDPWQMIYVFDNNSSTNVVCEGYAKAFQYLCDLSSFKSSRIACYTVSGLMNGGRHMWNIATMENGKNYLVDVTNCDGNSVGHPDRLFLAGASSGSVNGGYTFNLGSRSITYTYSDENKAMYGSSILSLSRENYVVKEDPKLTLLPHVSAVYGQKLSELHLSNPANNTRGSWSWQTPDTLVGNAGTRTFTAVFTPEDSRAYRTATRSISVTVSRKTVSAPTITPENGPYYYTGQAVCPTVTVKDGSTVIPESEYTLTYANNTSIGNATITITNKTGGNYQLSGSHSRQFAIIPADLAQAAVELSIPQGGYIYDKTEKQPSVRISIKGSPLNAGLYSVSYANNVNAGIASVTVSAADTVHCQGTKRTAFTIGRRPVNLKCSAKDKVYDGTTDVQITNTSVDGSPFISNDEVQVHLEEAVGRFADSQPGTNKPIIITTRLTGRDAANYEIKSPSVTADISAYIPVEVNTAISTANAAKSGITATNQSASAVTFGTRFVSDAELTALNNAIKKAENAKANPLTQAQSAAAAAELNRAVETFRQAIKTGTYRQSSGGGGGGSGGGGSGGSKTTSSASTTYGPSSPTQGIVLTDGKRGTVNTLTGVITGSINGFAGDGFSHWQQSNIYDSSSWKLQYADGSYAAGSMMMNAAGFPYEQVAWELVNGAWYAFGADANAKNGWVIDFGAGRWYFVDINSGMRAGWVMVNGLWYYLNPDASGISMRPFGAMYQNERTPDGYFVNLDGAWDGGLPQ